VSSWYALVSSYLDSITPVRTGDENRVVRPSVCTHSWRIWTFFVEFYGELCEKLLSRYGFQPDRTALTTASREEDLYAFLLGSPV